MVVSAELNGDLVGDWVILYDGLEAIDDGDRLKFIVGEVYHCDGEAPAGRYAFDGKRIELELSAAFYITGTAIRDPGGDVVELCGFVHSDDFDEPIRLIRASVLQLSWAPNRAWATSRRH